MIRTKFTSPEKKKSRPGPKPLFHQGMIQQVYKLAQFGCTNEECAELLKISLSTFESYTRRIPAFYDALQRGRLWDSMKLVKTCHRAANGFRYTERYETWSIQKDGTQRLTSRRVEHKYARPDVTALIYILKTRHGDKWMDIYKTEFAGKISHHQVPQLDLSGFTEEERRVMKKIGLTQLMLTNGTTRN